MSEQNDDCKGADRLEIVRLTRRVARERAQRIKAEADAEAGLRAMYEIQREAELMRGIAMDANEAPFVSSALKSCLDRLCAHVGSPVANAWICPDATDLLVATGIWHLDDTSRFLVLRGVTDGRWMRRDEGLPGRVLATGRPAWIENVTADGELTRNTTASDLGVKAAFAFPVLSGQKVAAVLEFFFEEAKPANERILGLAADIGAQLGRVIERQRASAADARARYELEARVRMRTDLERANAELRREISERDAADAANRAKSEFLANMSHEIRTPLTAVLGYTDLLMDGQISPSDRLTHLQTIRRNGEHLLTLINDILDLSKIEAGKMEIETISFSPSQIVVDVASLMRVRALEKGLSFAVDFATPIPALIQGDPTRLRQVLLNFTGNAIKFTDRGSVRMIVRLDQTSEPPTISFEVADEGIGMSPEQLDRLFRPFTQADSSMTRRFGGSGLGLVISKRLTDMMGGQLSVESIPGRGSSFKVSVGTGSLEGVSLLRNLEEAGIPGAENSEHKGIRIEGRILLAEDGVDNQLLVSTVLRKGGATVEIAENGRIAMEMALAGAEAGNPFDVILMDMQMPELDGYGATARLRGKEYSRPIIALTAHAMSTDRDRCLAAGCDDFLTKPINRQALLSTIRKYLDIVRAGRPTPRAAAAPVPVVVAKSLPPLYGDDEICNEEGMLELVQRFVGSLKDRVEALRNAERAGDVATLNRLAHQLKGSAAGYGFMPITVSAATLETVTHESQDASEIKLRVADLVALCMSARIRQNTNGAGQCAN